MSYQDGTHDPVSAAELAHDRASEDAPWWTCQRCGAELWEEDAAAQNWLVCKRLECPQVLCEDCVIVGCEESNCNEFAAVYCNWESVHNAGFCSPACMARELEAHGWEYRKGRLLDHCYKAHAEALRIADDKFATEIRIVCVLASLIDKVRAVCNLERK